MMISVIKQFKWPRAAVAHGSLIGPCWLGYFSLSLSLFVIESLISKCYDPLRRTQIPPTDKWSADAHAPSVEKGEVRFKKRLKNRSDYGTVCVVFPSLPCRRHFIKLINNRPPFFTPSPSVLAALDATQQKETICLPTPLFILFLSFKMLLLYLFVSFRPSSWSYYFAQKPSSFRLPDPLTIPVGSGRTGYLLREQSSTVLTDDDDRSYRRTRLPEEPI